MNVVAGLVLILTLILVCVLFLLAKGVRRRGVKGLWASRQHFRAVAQTAHDAIVSADRSGRIIYFNPEAQRLFGYGPRELLGRPLTLLMPERFHKAHQAGFARYLATGQAHVIGRTVELAGLKKDGTEFPLELSLAAWKGAGESYFTAIIRDITERKKSEEKLRQAHEELGLKIEERTSELVAANRKLEEEMTRRIQAQGEIQQLASIVESSDDAIVGLSPGGQILSWNRGAWRVFGYEKEEVLGKSIAILVPPERSQELTHMLEKIRGGEPMIQYETVRKRKDGRWIEVSLTASPVREAARVIGISAIYRDISERKAVDRLKTQFLSTVSHELRTPLTAMEGALELIAKGAVGKISGSVKGLIEMASRNCQRLMRLIGDILDNQAIEAGKIQLRIEPLPLISLVKEAMEDNEYFARQYAVRFILESSLSEVKVYGDSDRLMQVLTNLLSNAAKFSRPHQEVKVAVSRHGNKIQLAVTDQGVVIPEKFRARIFQRFSQADSSDSRARGGTGLGLWIAKTIIEKLGGEIGYESSEKKGTTFYFDLPECAPATPATDFVKTSRWPRVLICEDDRDVATLLKLMLAQSGFKSDIAYNASQTKKLLEKSNYGALTVDLALPDQSGISLIRELRSKDRTRFLPIVVVSAKAQQAVAEFADEELGVLDWLDKPIDPDRLIARMKQVLDLPREFKYRGR